MIEDPDPREARCDEEASGSGLGHAGGGTDPGWARR